MLNIVVSTNLGEKGRSSILQALSPFIRYLDFDLVFKLVFFSHLNFRINHQYTKMSVSIQFYSLFPKEVKLLRG